MNCAEHNGQVALLGLDGANPLGFLSALGALVAATASGYADARLGWRRDGKWVPMLSGLQGGGGHRVEDRALSEAVASSLAGRAVPKELDLEREQAQRQFEAAKKQAAKKRKEIKKRGLKGNDRKAAIELEVAPLEDERDKKRDAWLGALARAVPRPELALGKRLDCTADEYRQHAAGFRKHAGHADREALGLLAAFGSDACLALRSDSIEATPFQFITGSGHQFFLETVEKLIAEVTPERVHQTLFEPWQYGDEGLSMRWDPVEDRRYALMDRDPTASGNKARTVWMANLLAYRALVLFPSAPGAGGLHTTGWTESDDPTFSWPLWGFPAPPDTIRSLMQLSGLGASRPDSSVLDARGIQILFRARRIKVGAGANFKLNFSPARVIAVAARSG